MEDREMQDLGDGRDASPAPEFKFSEPPAFPERTYSGNPVKTAIIRGMARQHDEFSRANCALDRMIVVLRATLTPHSAPPPPLTAHVGGE